MKRVVFMSSGPDLAGCGYALKRAFDRHAPDWEARAVCRQTVYLDYPTDIVWLPGHGSARRREVTQLVRAADVLHVLDNEKALLKFAPFLRGKTVVVHHLGSHFRRHETMVSRTCRRYGAIEVTDSIDLLRPHVGWQPVPADFDALAELRAEHYRPSDRIRIAHAPTDRQIKSTEIIKRTVESLARRYPIDFDLIERVTNRECLVRKARADIFVDQLGIGFGVNAIECWAMGIPVVSGLVDPAARENALAMWSRFPWADATPQTLEAVVEHLVTDPEWRTELGERGRKHGLEWHSEPAVVQRMLALYGVAGEAAA
jgi:hypothetical protein